jgi:hypothetical protein
VDIIFLYRNMSRGNFGRRRGRRWGIREWRREAGRDYCGRALEITSLKT